MRDRYAICAALLLCAVLSLIPNSTAWALQNGERVPGRLIINLVPGVIPDYPSQKSGQSVMGIASIDALNSRNGLQSFRSLFPGSPSARGAKALPDLRGYHVLEFPKTIDLDRAADEYRADPNVATVEFDSYALAYATPNDPRFPQMWGLSQPSDHDIDATEAWDVTTGAETVILGVTDTGVLYDHEDLVNNIWVNPGEDLDHDSVVYDSDDMNGVDDDGNGYVDDVIGWDFVVDGATAVGFPVWPGEDGLTADNNPRDFNGHGSHTSGTIAATTNNGIGVSGIAGGYQPSQKGSKIMCLRMGWSLDYYGSEYGVTVMSYVAEAFVYAANMGARAINYSYGSGDDGGIQAATDYAVANGVIIVAAAGNDGSSSGLGYLQSRADVLCVAATNQSDGKAYFSNYGSLVDISAPGMDIWSTVSNHYSPGYAQYSGTSMAAPHVVGVIGLMLSINPTLNLADVRTILDSSAEPTTDYVGQMGSGRINANGALALSRALRISHTPLTNTMNTTGPYEVVAAIRSDTTLNPDSLAVYYRSSADLDSAFVRVSLLPTGSPDEYAAEIPGQPIMAEIDYGLVATDDRGESVSSPGNFPVASHHFRILGSPLLASYPDSFAFEIQGGHADSSTLVIRNDGTDNLLFSLSTSGATPAAIAAFVKNVLDRNASIPTAIESPFSSSLTVPAAQSATRRPAADVLAAYLRYERATSSEPLYAVVLDSWGSDYGADADWDELNANWGDYGENPVLIDYATFNHEGITYDELAAAGADVLIVSDAWGVGYGWEFTSSEFAAIRRYVDEGHGLFVTSGTLGDDPLAHVHAFAAMLGLDSNASFWWNSGPNSSPQNPLIPDHPLFAHITSPYEVSFPGTVAPAGGRWADVLSGAQLIAASSDGYTATTAYENRVYTSSMPEEVTTFGQTPEDNQFVYNAITFCGAASGCGWLSASPSGGSISPGDSALIVVKADATPFYQETTYVCGLNLRAEDSAGTDELLPASLHVLPPEYFVELKPVTAQDAAPIGDTVWYADTLTNFGLNTDAYALEIAEANWPSLVWDSNRLAPLSVTPAMALNDRYVVQISVIVPDGTVYGETDTLRLIVRSVADPVIAPVFTAVTGSFGVLDSLPWPDQFADPIVDTTNWRVNTGAVVNERGINEPSSPYSLNLDGEGGGDVLISDPIGLSQYPQVMLEYWYQRTGGGEMVDPGNDLIFEAFDSSGGWIEVSRQLGSGPSMFSSFAFTEVLLPPAALHDNFQLRVRSLGDGAGYDDWFVDNILLYAPIPPSICYDPASFAFSLNEGDTTKDTLLICNQGPGDLKFKLSVKSEQTPLAGTVLEKQLPGLDPAAGGAVAEGTPGANPQVAVAPSTDPGLFDDFEDGDYAGWSVLNLSYEREVTTATAARGRYSLRQTNFNYDGGSLAHSFAPSQYEYVGFYIRMATTNRYGGYVVVGDQWSQYYTGSIRFYADASGRFNVPGDASFQYQANSWYLVEFYVDWATQSFDYFVNGELIEEQLPFYNSASEFSTIHIFNNDLTTAWWDAIIVGDGPFDQLVSLSTTADTIPAGDTALVEVAINATGCGSGDYPHRIQITSNDPDQPLIEVPASIRVRGPEIDLRGDSIFLEATLEDKHPEERFWIFNIGEDTLRISPPTSDQSWLHIGKLMQSLHLSPGDSIPIPFHLYTAQIAPGYYSGNISILSNDFSEPDSRLIVRLHLGPDPQMVVYPESLGTVLSRGDSSTLQLDVSNIGEGTLAVWKILPVDITGTAILSSSPRFESTPVDETKLLNHAFDPSQPSMEHLYSMPSETSVAHPAFASGHSLEDVLEALDSNFIDVISAIPSRYDFSEGVTGTEISDGGGDMYDGGNYLSTDLGGPVAYSDGAIVPSLAFGPTGRYFTRKYPGLFVLVAETDEVPSFSISGNLGADGSGNVDGAILQTVAAGRPYSGFVKRVYNAFDPSVNHLVIVEHAAGHEFATNSNDDYHRVYSLKESDRLYYLLYAGQSGGYINDSSALEIMSRFLSAIKPEPNWITVVPDSFWTPAGSTQQVQVHFRANVAGEDHRSDLVFTTNDPARTTFAVPARLHVRTPEIVCRPDSLVMDILEGLSSDSTLWIINSGDAPLHAAIGAGTPWLSTVPTDVTVPVGDSLPVSVHGDAIALIPGWYSGILNVVSDDVSDSLLIVPVTAHVGPDPDVAIVPESLSVTLAMGDSISVPLAINNEGLGTLRFAIQPALVSAPTMVSRWTEIDPGSGVADSTSSTSPMDSANRVPTPPGSYGDASAPVRVALFQDWDPWGNRRLRDLLTAHGIAYAIFGHSSIGVVDLSPYDKVITASEQYNMRERMATYREWFEDYVENGGMLEMHLAYSVASETSILPGGFTVYPWYDVNQVTIAIPDHPVMTEPNMISETDLDYWYSSAIGHFNTLPAGSDVIATDTYTGYPICTELKFGGGAILATTQTVESYNASMAYLENLILYQGFGSWLSVMPMEGLVPPGGSASLDVRFNASGLARPDYYGLLRTSTNDPDEPSVDVPVHLHVKSPEIALRQDSLRVDVLETQSSDSTLWIINEGDGTLDLTVAADVPWLSASPTPASVLPGDSLGAIVHVDATSLIAGEYTGHLTLMSNDFDEPELSATIVAHVGPDPDIAIVPESISVTLPSGDSVAVPLTISNLGLGTLAYEMSISKTVATSEWIEDLRRIAPAGQEPGHNGGQQSAPAQSPPTSITTISGDYLVFDITDYGEIMPFQYPPGNEHLRLGTYLSGFTVAYTLSGIDYLGYDYYDYRSNITPISRSVVLDTPDRVQVEVLVRTGNGNLQIRRLFDFGRHDKFVRVTTTLLNLTAMPMENVVFKDGADWDMDGMYANDWGFDSTRALVYAWNVHWGALIPGRLPERIDVDGWDDYDRRETDMNAPPGDYSSFDGALILHHELGTLLPAATTEVIVAFAAADDLTELQEIADRAIVPFWLSVSPEKGLVAPGSSAILDVRLNATRLERPDYFATFLAASNDPDEPMTEVPVHLHVQSPELEIHPPSLMMEVNEGAMSDSVVWILNTGDGNLHVTVGSAEVPWLSGLPTNMSVPPADSLPLTVRSDATGLVPGNFSASLPLTTTDYDEANVSLPVSLHVGPDPEINIVPDSISVELTEGDSAVVSLALENTGLGTLAFASQISYTGVPAARKTARIAAIPNPIPLTPASTYSLEGAMNGSGPVPDAALSIPFPGNAAGIAFSSSGQLYAAVYSNDKILRLTPGNVWETYSASVLVPYGIAFDRRGQLAVAEPSNQDVVLVDSTGAVHSLANDIGYSPFGMAYDPLGNLLVTTEYESHILTIAPDGSVSTFADSLPTTFAAAFGPDGRLYVSTFDAGRILAITPEGAVSTYVTIEAYLEGLAFDVEGNLYCANGYMGYIYRIAPDQTVEVVGTGYPGPLNLALDESGLLHISSIDVQRIDTLRVGIPGVHLPVGGNWLSIAPTEGLVPPGGTSTIDLRIDATELDPKDYLANVIFYSNDPDETMVAVPVYLSVTPIINSCTAPCHGDPNCDGIRADVLDVIKIINIAFRGTAPDLSAGTGCPYEDTDVDCSSFTDLRDVVHIINVAFRGADVNSEFCKPCP